MSPTVFTIRPQRTHANAGSVVFMDVVFSIVGVRRNDYSDTASLEVEEQSIHLSKTNGHWHDLETAAALLHHPHD